MLGGRGGPGEEPQTITQPEDIRDGPHAGDDFGHEVAAGDVDGDRLADIIVGARKDDDDRGSVTVIRGARSGYSKSAAFELKPEAPEVGNLGGSLALLDVDGDGLRDLAVARENTSSLNDAVVVFLRDEDRFGAGETLGGLTGLADWDRSPLRIGR